MSASLESKSASPSSRTSSADMEARLRTRTSKVNFILCNTAVYWSENKSFLGGEAEGGEEMSLELNCKIYFL